MQQIPEECPIRDILSQIKSVLDLLNKILEHCEECIKSRGKEDKNG